MWKPFSPKTIRGKIMLLTAAITLLITVLTTTVCFSVFQSFLRKNQIQSTEFSLQVVSNNIAADMKDIIYFSKWCFSNDTILDYLETFKNQDKLPTISKDRDSLRPVALSTHSRLKEEYYRSNEYMSRVIISSNNINNFLQVSAAANDSPSYSAKAISQESFFNRLYEANDFLWIGLVKDSLPKTSREPYIPIVRPAYNKFDSEIIGWTYVEISSRLFTDYLSAYPLPSDSMLFITLGEKTYEFHKGGWQEVQKPYTNEEKLAENNALSKGTQVLSITMNGGEKRILVERPVEGMEGWSLSQVLSEQQFSQQKYLYTLLIMGICFAIVSLGVLLVFLLNRIIMEPIRKLSRKIDDISAGDFSMDRSMEWDHELGQVGRGINNMSENIVTLMEKRVDDEKQKKDLEYQILQSQINPHFLYNTLNSIKWMATIQNAGGIADMITALARLLKNISKGTSSMISLKEELALVKDYFLIQQYRYGGGVAIEYSIESEDLYDCEIHRFTLQPIIENALFHGIEPKGMAGTIAVTAETAAVSSQKALKITVRDNGVGMSQDTIDRILLEDGDAQNKTEFFRHVGINNVNKRIQHDFGPEYGITITSRPGDFTAMTILRPYVIHLENTSSGKEDL
ncbi:MAG: sensor histidine kinase [Lacrimispora sp.]|uniref:sensor histidine kinase n=1 Tax=Lacrimispora sp. TaxID=2719234 RepID=UPI0039E6D71F